MADQIEMSTAESPVNNFFRQNVNFFWKPIPIKTTFTFNTSHQNTKISTEKTDTSEKRNPVEVNTSWTPYDVSMADCTKRINSFISWPKQMAQRPPELAASGFYYTGYGDVVQCFFCGILLKYWLHNDKVDVEHKHHSPDCKFHCMVRRK